MAGLGDLIKKQKEASGGATASGSTHGNGTDAVTGSAGTSVDSQPSESMEAATAPAPTPAATKFRFGGGAAKPVESPATGNAIVPVAAKPAVAESSKPAGGTSLAALKLSGKSDSGSAAGMSDALAAIAASESAGSVPVNVGGDDLEYVPQFPDLVDCKVPDRELPADITLEAKGFVEQLDQIYGIAYDPELFGQFVRTIMQELQEHPDYIKLMSPEDSYVLVRGLREAMGMAAVKKESKKKSTTASSKKAPKSSEMDSLLDSFGRRGVGLMSYKNQEPLDNIWKGMIWRCHRVISGRTYDDYLGRGITVYEGWRNDREAFKTWAKANGYAPGLTLERKNNDDGYNPWNCVWATRSVQQRNKRNTVMVEGIPLMDWCEKHGIDHWRVRDRLKAGVDPAILRRNFGHV